MPKSKKRKSAKPAYFVQKVKEMIKIQKPNTDVPDLVPTGRIVKITHMRKYPKQTSMLEQIANLPTKSDES